MLSYPCISGIPFSTIDLALYPAADSVGARVTTTSVAAGVVVIMGEQAISKIAKTANSKIVFFTVSLLYSSRYGLLC